MTTNLQWTKVPGNIQDVYKLYDANLSPMRALASLQLDVSTNQRIPHFYYSITMFDGTMPVRNFIVSRGLFTMKSIMQKIENIVTLMSYTETQIDLTLEKIQP